MGLMEYFVKVFIEKGTLFTYLRGNVPPPRLTYEEVNADVFLGPQIRQRFNDQQFKAMLSD